MVWRVNVVIITSLTAYIRQLTVIFMYTLQGWAEISQAGYEVWNQSCKTLHALISVLLFHNCLIISGQIDIWLRKKWLTAKDIHANIQATLDDDAPAFSVQKWAADPRREKREFWRWPNMWTTCNGHYRRKILIVFLTCDGWQPIDDKSNSEFY